MYRYGEGVEQDLEPAFSWYRKAAELNYAPAQFHTGTMLADGRGTPKDVSEAVGWLTKAAEARFERTNEKQNELNIFLNEQTNSRTKQTYFLTNKRMTERNQKNV